VLKQDSRIYKSSGTTELQRKNGMHTAVAKDTDWRDPAISGEAYNIIAELFTRQESLLELW